MQLSSKLKQIKNRVCICRWVGPKLLLECQGEGANGNGDRGNMDGAVGKDALDSQEARLHRVSFLRIQHE